LASNPNFVYKHTIKYKLSGKQEKNENMFEQKSENENQVKSENDNENKNERYTPIKN